MQSHNLFSSAAELHHMAAYHRHLNSKSVSYASMQIQYMLHLYSGPADPHQRNPDLVLPILN
jgi:hypothetical protein